MNSGALRPISGIGSKGPACFLLETGGTRLLLDIGEGPPPGKFPDVAGLPRVDAVILSHGRHGIDDIYVDAAMRDALQRLAGSDQISLRTGLRDEIERLVQIVKPIDGAHGIMLAASADGASGATAKLLGQCEDTPEVTILFTAGAAHAESIPA